MNGDGCSSTCTLESCGDGIIDVNEDCDDGAQNGVNNCCSLICQLLDPDEDGICNRDDICPADDDNDSDGDSYCIGLAFNPPAIGGGDPCSRTVGAGAWTKPQAQFSKLDTPLVDDKLKLQGEFLVPTGSPAIAPHLFGVQIRVTDAAGRSDPRSAHPARHLRLRRAVHRLEGRSAARRSGGRTSTR